jgi:hypothetical protein
MSPPRTIQALEKNQEKLSRHTDLLTPKLQRNLQQICKHNQQIFESNQIIAENLAMANDTIS